MAIDEECLTVKVCLFLSRQMISVVHVVKCPSLPPFTPLRHASVSTTGSHWMGFKEAVKQQETVGVDGVRTRTHNVMERIKTVKQNKKKKYPENKY